jgi:hypothetical protein
VAVEVLAAPVVDGCGAGVGVTSGDLDVSQRHAGVECGHDERGSQHVRVRTAHRWIRSIGKRAGLGAVRRSWQYASSVLPL